MNVVTATRREKEKLNYMTMSVPEEPTKETPTNDTKKPSATKRRGSEGRKPPNKPAGRSSKPAESPRNARVARPGTKGDKILKLLRRPGGVSLQELRKATGWQAHSVRGFLSGTMKKKFGYRVHSTRQKNGERVYRIAAK
jgi:hypothetical protein